MQYQLLSWHETFVSLMMMIATHLGRLKRSGAEASVTSEGLLSALCAQKPTQPAPSSQPDTTSSKRLQNFFNFANYSDQTVHIELFHIWVWRGCQQATNGKRQSVLCSRQFWRRNYFCHFLAGAESSWRRMAQSQVGKWHTGLLPGWNTMHFLKFISEMQQCSSSSSTTGVGSIE